MTGKPFGLVLLLILSAACQQPAVVRAQQDAPAFRDADLPLDTRVSDLLHRLTLEEKISLLGYRNEAVTRLGVPAYTWWNEALHGVARAGKATVFPQAIGMAASFDNELMYRVADAISTEARAKYNLAAERGRRGEYQGLTFWSPNINLFRDPRWGRGQETYGEDPFLTAVMGTAFVRGLQGNDPRHLKTAACAKHFALYSGPEGERHAFNAVVDEKDLRETYLYAFRKLVDAGVESIMCAYNRVNGEPCCTGPTLLRKILRDEWKFRGQVVTDCWALEDVWSRHKVLATSVDVAAAAVRAGVNLDCSNLLQDDVMKAIGEKLLTAHEVDSALAPTLRTQFRLGFYDSPGRSPYAHFGADSVANGYHAALARRMARESMVVLKNDGILPLEKNRYSSMMVVGPNAASLDALLGSYHGVSGKAVNFVEGISEAADAATRVEYDQGCDFADTVHFGGLWAAAGADITIAVIGLTPVYEGEEGDAFLSPGGRGDRKSLSLPASHVAYMKALRSAHRKPIIAVITAGSAVDVAAVEAYADAIILAWYPGEQGGNALADILFGMAPPSGRLPVTFYPSIDSVPPFDSYAMKGRTYRYYGGRVQYPFGFGLGYTSFTYAWAREPALSGARNDEIALSVGLKNRGNVDGVEVVQAYVEYPPAEGMPLRELKAFRRLEIPAGKDTVAELRIPVTDLEKWDAQRHQWKLCPGEYAICIGRNARDMVLRKQITIR